VTDLTVGILDAPTTYCPGHERLESFEIERVERDIRPEAVEVRVRLKCGHTKRIVQPDEEAL
jgi:hypothetical protein